MNINYNNNPSSDHRYFSPSINQVSHFGSNAYTGASQSIMNLNPNNKAVLKNQIDLKSDKDNFLNFNSCKST